MVHLEPWDSKKIYDRLGIEDHYTEILDLQVPCVTIPVRPGRNLASIVEVAAMNNRLRRFGFNAAEELVRMGFTVLPYINADPVLAKRLEDVGVAAVMPLGSPIGSNQGIKTEAMLRIIIEQSNVPVVVDAGLGLPSHAAQAIELGADAILVNSAIAAAGNPCAMAEAFASAVAASEKAILAGPAAVLGNASASSPADLFSEVI